jgi:hypothetical protein
MRGLGLIVAVALVASVLTILATNPRLAATQAQEAIVSRFLQAYCHPDPKWRDDFRLGETAAASRTAVEAGIGGLTVVEFAKCKLMAEVK